MTVLVAGASGATARLLAAQLLHRGMSVRVIVRPHAILPERVAAASNLTVIRAAILDLGDEELAGYGQNPAVSPRTVRMLRRILLNLASILRFGQNPSDFTPDAIRTRDLRLRRPWIVVHRIMPCS